MPMIPSPLAVGYCSATRTIEVAVAVVGFSWHQGVFYHPYFYYDQVSAPFALLALWNYFHKLQPNLCLSNKLLKFVLKAHPEALCA